MLSEKTTAKTSDAHFVLATFRSPRKSKARNGTNDALTKISHAILHVKLVLHTRKCFNSTCEMKHLCVKSIFIRESSISYMKYMFCIPKFYMWNFKPCHLTCGLGVSYMKTFYFQVRNENFICENVPILRVSHVK